MGVAKVKAGSRPAAVFPGNTGLRPGRHEMELNPFLSCQTCANEITPLNLREISMNATKTASVLLTTFFMLGFCLNRAHADQLLTNGDFETGDFTGWTEVDQTPGYNGGPPAGTFSISTPGFFTPTNGDPTVPNPSGGSSYAVDDEGDPSSSVLYQSFVVPPNEGRLTLTFQMFINNYNGTSDAPNTLDFTSAAPNQQVRVDILNNIADPFSVDPVDVEENLFTSTSINDSVSPFPNDYATYSFDLTGLDAAPGTYYVRFAQVDNEQVQVVGVDNVSIIAAPEPSTYALMLAGLALLGFAVKRKRAAVVVS
jgi:hypothetical protein